MHNRKKLIQGKTLSEVADRAIELLEEYYGITLSNTDRYYIGRRIQRESNAYVEKESKMNKE
jgi:hypothetical protein